MMFECVRSGIWILEFGIWNLELGTWVWEFGIGNLDFGIWILELVFWNWETRNQLGQPLAPLARSYADGRVDVRFFEVAVNIFRRCAHGTDN